MRFDSRSAALGTAALAVLGAVIATLLASSGAYNIAADRPHTLIVRNLVGYVTSRSIAVRASSVSVPNLNDARMIVDGASDYDAMCTGCHLAPGMAENEMRPGMNPKPPLLSEKPFLDPATQFWIIKHGIKMSGMPAWGMTHGDEEIWNIVAFVQNLPKLSPAQYHALVAKAAGHHEMDENEPHHMDMSH